MEKVICAAMWIDNGKPNVAEEPHFFIQKTYIKER